VRYLLLLYLSERPDPGSPAAAEGLAAMSAFHAECTARGVLLGSAPLEPPSTATTVREESGRLVRSAGPFAETREWLAGYFLLDCRDEAEALELAERCPTARDGAVEVRALLDYRTSAASDR
jgi:hypothetical protein